MYLYLYLTISTFGLLVIVLFDNVGILTLTLFGLLLRLLLFLKMFVFLSYLNLMRGRWQVTTLWSLDLLRVSSHNRLFFLALCCPSCDLTLDRLKLISWLKTQTCQFITILYFVYLILGSRSIIVILFILKDTGTGGPFIHPSFQLSLCIYSIWLLHTTLHVMLEVFASSP